MFKEIKELIQYRELLWTLAVRDIKVRYKQSVLGAGWAILQPLSLMLIFTLVFSRIAKIPSEGIPYPIFSYCALLPWTFFSASLSFASSSLINNRNLVTKIYFPRDVLPLASTMACFFDFIIASFIFLGMMFYYNISFTSNLLWIPLIILIQIFLTIGIGFISAALNVFYRDIKYIIPLVVQIWMYLSPIIYPMSLVPKKYLPYYILNPMVGIIDSYRQVILYGKPPDFQSLFISLCFSFGIFYFGYKGFKDLEGRFADVI